MVDVRPRDVAITVAKGAAPTAGEVVFVIADGGVSIEVWPDARIGSNSMPAAMAYL
jgi:hypothetical protein